MDRPQQREIVFCHQCDNEWYRDENGLQCPECRSEFTEIVEGANDPRAQEQEAVQAAAANNHPLHDHNPWDAPDPDEEDIDHFQWNRAPPGEFDGQRYHATFNRTYNMGAGGQAQGQAGGAAGGGLLGMIGNIVGGLLQQPNQQQGHEHQHQHQYGFHGHDHSHDDAQGQGNEVSNRGAATSPPGSPNHGDQSQGRPGVFTRHIHGPGYSFTMTASSSSNLSPRNANGPQPFNAQPQDMDELMQQMFNNIGAFPPLHAHDHDHPRRGPGGAPIFPATLLQLLNNLGPPGGVHGDAVYSQEALDRIVSQLMEQHQTGNAPGPASENAIKSLPKRPITQADAGDNGTADCSICMDAVPLGDTVTVLPCSHWFHHDCIRAWLSEHDTCPHCRKGIMPRDSTAEGAARESSQAPLHDQHAQPAQQPLPGSSNSGGVGGSGGGAGSSGGNSAGVFSRMRDAFGSGARRHSTSGGGGGGSGGGPGDSHPT